MTPQIFYQFFENTFWPQINFIFAPKFLKLQHQTQVEFTILTFTILGFYIHSLYYNPNRVVFALIDVILLPLYCLLTFCFLQVGNMSIHYIWLNPFIGYISLYRIRGICKQLYVGLYKICKVCKQLYECSSNTDFVQYILFLGFNLTSYPLLKLLIRSSIFW